MPGWQGSDQGVCWNRPSALDSLGDLEATAVPRAVVGPNWLVIRSQKFPDERRIPWESNLSVFRTPRVRKRPDKNDENCPDCSSL
jgi:hypothetical protein